MCSWIWSSERRCTAKKYFIYTSSATTKAACLSRVKQQPRHTTAIKYIHTDESAGLVSPAETTWLMLFVTFGRGFFYISWGSEAHYGDNKRVASKDMLFICIITKFGERSQGSAAEVRLGLQKMNISRCDVIFTCFIPHSSGFLPKDTWVFGQKEPGIKPPTFWLVENTLRIPKGSKTKLTGQRHIRFQLGPVPPCIHPWIHPCTYHLFKWQLRK